VNHRRLPSTRYRRTRRPAVALLAASAVFLLGGCGSRLSTAEIRAGGSVAGTQVLTDGSATGAAAAGGGGAGAAVPLAGGTTGAVTGDTTAGAAAAPAAGAAAAPVGGAAPAAGAAAAPAAGAGGAAAPAAGAGAAPAAAAASTNIMNLPIFGGNAPCTPATGSPIKLGNVSTVSGVLGELFSPVVPALQTFVKSQNACGGLNGHQIQLIVGDDQGDPSTAVSVAQRQIQNDHIVAFLGNIQVLTVDAMVDVVKKSGIPIIGGDLTNNTWFTQPLMFPQGSPPQAISYGYVQVATERYHKSKFASIYCLEVPQACSQIDKAFRELGGSKVVYSTQVSITSPSYTSQCLDAQKSGADLVALTFDAASMKRFAKSCDSVGYHPQWLGYPLGVGNEKQFLGEPLLGNMYIPLNTFAWMANSTPAEKYWQSSVKKFNPGFVSGDAAGLGWTAGALIVAASQKLTDKPTTQQFLDGLYALKNQTLGGLTTPLTYVKGGSPRIKYCLFAAIANKDGSGWQTPVSVPACTDVRAPSDPNK
jgi:branched-chain amino acid transport system substrate-binding protein